MDRARREIVASFSIGGVAALVALWVSRAQMAGGPDAVTYLSIAESLARGGGFNNWLEQPMTTFPPAWPFVIWALSALGLSDDWAAMVAIMASLVAIPPLTMVILRRCTDVAMVRMLGVVCVALSPIVLPWGYLGLSEVPFTALVLGCTAAAVVAREGRREWLIWVGVGLGALLPVFRYAGVAVPCALAAWIAWCWPRRRWVTAAAAAVLGLLPLAAVVVRNVVVSDHPFGGRPPSSLTPVQVAQQTLATVGRGALWTLDSAPDSVSVLLGLAIVVLLGIVVVRQGPSEPAESHASRVLVVLFAVSQLLVMAVARASAEIDDLDDRLLAPATVLVLLVAATVVGDLWSSPNRVIRVAGLGCLVLWCVVGVAAMGRGAMQNSPDSYLGTTWDDLRASALLEEIPPDCRAMDVGQVTGGGDFPSCGILANDPWGWFSSDVQPLMSPRRQSGTAGPSDMQRVRSAVDDGATVYLLWTTVSDPYGYLLTVDEIDEQVDVSEIATDGPLTLYRIGSGADSPS